MQVTVSAGKGASRSNRALLSHPVRLQRLFSEDWAESPRQLLSREVQKKDSNKTVFIGA